MRPHCPSKTSDGISFGMKKGVTPVNLLPRRTTVNPTATLQLAFVEFVPEETCLKRYLFLHANNTRTKV